MSDKSAQTPCRNCGGGPQFGHQTWCGTAPGKRYAAAPAADAAELLAELGAVWSPDFGAYAAGELDLSRVRCALCGLAPCVCPPFGTPEYFALLDRVHGRAPRYCGCHLVTGRPPANGVHCYICDLPAAPTSAPGE